MLLLSKKTCLEYLRLWDTSLGRFLKVSSVFIRRGGMIQGRVNGHRRYSADLAQGGLEIPCILTYTINNKKEWVKTKRTINVTLGLITADSMDGLVNLEALASIESSFGSTPPVAVESPGSMIDLTAHCSSDDQSPPKKKPKLLSKEDIIMGQELSDLEINFAQDLLQGQYPKLTGLQSTLFQERNKLFPSSFITNCI